MKNYLSFHLDAKQLFPYWISSYLLGIILAVIYVFRSQEIVNGDNSFATSMMLVITFFLLLGVGFIFYFYLVKFTTDSIEHKGERMVTSYSISQFIGTFFLGAFLSIITLGIYVPWFIQRLISMFVEGASYKGVSYKFKGDGLTLLGILTLIVVVPIIAITFVAISIYGIDNTMEGVLINIYQLIILAPLYALIFNWLVNGEYNGYHISLNGKFLNTAAYIFGQLLLVVVTIGIYFPLFYLNIYRYILMHTSCANAAGDKVVMDYDIDSMGDFLFVWGQLLLTIVTIGIYFPWAYAKVMNRIVSKTSLV